MRNRNSVNTSHNCHTARHNPQTYTNACFTPGCVPPPLPPPRILWANTRRSPPASRLHVRPLPYRAAAAWPPGPPSPRRPADSCRSFYCAPPPPCPLCSVCIPSCTVSFRPRWCKKKYLKYHIYKHEMVKTAFTPHTRPFLFFKWQAIDLFVRSEKAKRFDFSK